ncbi:MAG: hypothetical protein KIS76_06535 [Pyrinomonadaceae bacterium]|nr:hypothetical protein [Pyrinomonadaceae bacterium]
MRRKVIQDFANVFCQRILLLPEAYDLASFVHYGSGTYELDILSGECRFNGNPIPKLRTCDSFKDWLLAQLEKHHILREAIEAANLKIDVEFSLIDAGQSYGHEFASAHFSFSCRSELRTDEKIYTSSATGEKTWEIGYYYNLLYGSVLKLAASL